ncbi:TPA: hypothetical protein ACN983_004769 [Vibrio parahaemolyticus]
MSSFFIGAKTRVLKGKAAPKGKGDKGRVFPREKPYPERVITKKPKYRQGDSLKSKGN